MTDATTKYWREKFWQSERARIVCLEEKKRLKQDLAKCLREKQEAHDELRRVK